MWTWGAIYLFLLLIYYTLQSKFHVRKYQEFYKTPTLFYLPVVGNIIAGIGKNMLTLAREYVDKYGTKIIAYIPHRIYMTSDPEEVKIILNDALNKSREYDYLQIVFRDSLLLAPVTTWKKTRKNLSKGFKQNILESFVCIFYKKSCKLNKILANKDYDSICFLMGKYALDIFSETVIGINSTMLTTKHHPFVTSFHSLEQELFNRLGNIIKMNEFLYQLLPSSKVALQHADILHKYIQNIIDKKRSQVSNDEIVFNSIRLPVLDLLLKEKDNNPDMKYITKEIMLFAAAATDTTSHTLAYTFLLLAMHPKDQEKVYEEVMSVIGQDREIDIHDLCNLKYMEMVICESMRLLPVVPFIGRQATTDIDIGNKIIPKDTSVIINILELHRDEKYFPNPLIFDTSRFLPEQIKKRHSYSYLPFSGGPRNCIGKKYAQILLKITLANVIRNFRLTTKYKSIDELKLESNMIMSPTHILDINFIKRIK